MAFTLSAQNVISDAILVHVKDGISDAAIRLRDGGGVLLATLQILPGDEGSVDPLTATITLNPGADEDNAPATGTAATGDLINRSGVVIDEGREVVQGTVAIKGKIVISSTAIVAGGSVRLIGASMEF